MSIQSEITRISGNVADALIEIEAKGVTIPADANSDDLASLIRSIPSGTVVSVVDTTDAAGGTIRTITAVSLAGDTVSPSSLLSGYTAHNSQGQAIVGTASGGGGTTETWTFTMEDGTTVTKDVVVESGLDSGDDIEGAVDD